MELRTSRKRDEGSSLNSAVPCGPVGFETSQQPFGRTQLHQVLMPDQEENSAYLVCWCPWISSSGTSLKNPKYLKQFEGAIIGSVGICLTHKSKFIGHPCWFLLGLEAQSKRISQYLNEMGLLGLHISVPTVTSHGLWSVPLSPTCN